MSFSLLIVSLILAHLIADFYWQPMSWVHDRNTRHFRASKLYLHVLIHGASSFLVLLFWEFNYGWQALSNVVIATAVIMVTHYLIDLAKSYSSKGVVPFIVDQLAHLVILFLLAIWLSENDEFFTHSWQWLMQPATLWVLCGYLLILNPTAVFIRMMLERITSGFSTTGSLPAAGQSIGMLERVLMLTFILLDQFSGVGFLLAAKSVFRFGDLSASRDKKLTEYVMLGTLLSVSVTLFIGLAVNYLKAV
ncbi:DUF3307 domain-containing protein [Pseudoalteromonas shioyasakiensis]|uniref:DUF3307 domain-containing protein n=1 Tax=Pseudoalteromonas TaxID=53246 RepID=UPI001431ECC5|nr:MULTISPECIES: DUF3307 domain-containing protein [Pseudoalteromonas]MCP4585999.1 DUF3307 domain-containing protein [Pseudoalteromonas sp.]MCQ8882604.1 DUF3307 domain-containing protein [Pseudoalteromonas shioyasakiensis]NIZ04869.1 DUF3307 domain-containing protein [Pseudoalteromonas sp. HF66]|tara:strand:- start:160 stop:906 length:747 start_codon:yes stop_codon:yes gene_type:complete